VSPEPLVAGKMNCRGMAREGRARDLEHTGGLCCSAARLTSWVPWLCVAGSRRVCLYRRAVAQSSVMLANVKPADIRGHTVARHQPAVDIRQPTGSRSRAQPHHGTTGLSKCR
jgi:hypothetical protein